MFDLRKIDDTKKTRLERKIAARSRDQQRRKQRRAKRVVEAFNTCLVDTLDEVTHHRRGATRI